MICLSLLVYLSLLSSITQPPPIVLCTTTSTTSRDKQPAKSDGLCSTDEMMSQMNLENWNELEQQGNNPAQPLEVPQLPAQPDEGPLLPLEGLEHQVLNNPLPPELHDFLQPPPEEREDQVLLDIPQLPAQPPEDPLLPFEGLEHQVLDIPLPAELHDFLQPPLEELEDQVLLDIPQLPAQPPEDPLLPFEGLEHQVLDIPLPAELQDFLQPPLEELEDQVLLDIPQLPAQPPEDPLLPFEGLEHQVLDIPLPAELHDFLQPPLEELEDQVLLDIPQLPAQPPEDPLLPFEGLEHQVLDIPLPAELQDFLQPPLEELEDQVLLDIPQLPAQPPEAPQQPAQQPEVPQPPDQVAVLPQPVNQMSIPWDNSRYSPSISGTASNNILSFFPGITPYLLRSGIPPYPLSSGIASNNGHYNPSSTGICWNNNPNPLSARLNPQLPAAQGSVFPQPSQEDGCNVTSSVMTSGNNDGKVERYGPEKMKECIERYRRKRLCQNWEKKIRYPIRKELSDTRPRRKGRYVSSSEAEPSHRYGLGVSDPDDTGSGSGSVIPNTTQCSLPTQQDASLESQELASPNSELRSQVHRQGQEGLIPPNWPNAPSESGDDAATLEQELRAIGFWESDAGGGDDHVPGEDPS